MLKQFVLITRNLKALKRHKAPKENPCNTLTQVNN